MAGKQYFGSDTCTAFASICSKFLSRIKRITRENYNSILFDEK